MMLYDEKEDGPLVKQENRVIINIWTSEDNKAIAGHNVGHVSLEANDRYMSLWPEARAQLKPSKNQLHRKIRSITNNFEVRPKNFHATYLDDAIAEAASEGRCTERQINDISELRENETALHYRALNDDFVEYEDGVALEERDELYAIFWEPIEANVRIALYSLDIDKIHRCFEDLKINVTGWSMIGSNGLQRVLDIPSSDNCASLVLRLLKAGGMYADLSSGATSATSSVVKPDVILTQVIAAKERELKTFAVTRSWTFKGESSLDAIKAAYALKGMTANAEESSWRSLPPKNDGATKAEDNAQHPKKEKLLSAFGKANKREEEIEEEQHDSGCRLF